MSITVLIADDHTVMRRGLGLLIDNEPDFEVVAQAADGREAIQACREHRPMVAILDINMPVTTGIAAASEIKANWPGTGIVMLTFQSQIGVVRSALRAGAHGYILKDSHEQELFDAVRAAAKGRRYISQYVAELVVGTMLEEDSDTTPPAGTGPEILRALSTREQQVLQMMAEGSSNNSIAATLNLSPKTVETYRSRLMHKLGVASFAELIRLAVRAGLVDTAQ